MATLPKHQEQQAAAEHATDFEAPIYNVWKQQTRTVGIRIARYVEAARRGADVIATIDDDCWR